MERRQLESFLAVAEAGSFTRASSRMSIAQPSLSYSIRAVERELGATLFERHGRGVRLTAAGGGIDGRPSEAIHGDANGYSRLEELIS